MKVRKFLLGFILLTAIICGYGEGAYSFEVAPTTVEQTLSISTVSTRLEEPAVSSRTIKEREGSAPVIYSYSLKVNNRFRSFPPRASPLL
ncbi:MAG: hypothetical protein ABGX12_01270 [Desulfurobacteriaceae bacterium]